MLVDPEQNVDLILPLLDDIDPLIRWQVMHAITRTKKFLENDELIGVVIRGLLEDPSPEVRSEAAEALGYCKISSRAISALEDSRDHDFEIDEQLGGNTSRVAKDSLERIMGRL